MRLVQVTSLFSLLLCAACYTVDIAGQTSFNSCSPSRVITAGQGISDFKQRIARQTAVAPADSILDVALTFNSDVMQSDRDRITTYNGTNITNGVTTSSLKAEFRAQDLARYVADDSGRLSDAIIYIPACLTD